jgi:cyclophilin family peptidyl-prolyl cis-trans isomerase
MSWTPKSARLVGFLWLALCLLTGPLCHGATIVRFTTNLGTFDVELFDDTMPVTVANFLRYVDSSRYDSTIIHRSTTYNPADIQIVQGGGFALTGSGLSYVATDAPIPLEASGRNFRGTLAMARTEDLNSATSQWFFNCTDNPGLDSNYAVFGRVLGNSGLAVLDAMASVPVYNLSAEFGGAFSELPVVQETSSGLIPIFITKVERVSVSVTSFARVEQGFRINWSTSPAATPVNIERCSDLVGAAWEVISAGETSGTFTDASPPASKAFYRAVIP